MKKRYPVNEFNLGKNIYPGGMRLMTHIEHQSFMQITNWLYKIFKFFGGK